MTGRVGFWCNGEPVEVDDRGSLLEVLREQLGLRAAKDGCAPQGQCGCCTVLVDDRPRLACVTPPGRVSGRRVVTLEGLDGPLRDRLVDGFVATGGSQCGFCTPGILVRLAGLLTEGRTAPADVDRALAAHLCRCTGWQTIGEAFRRAAAPAAAARRDLDGAVARRDLDGAAARARLEGGVPQQIGPHVPLGAVGFADDLAPPGALVAVPLDPGGAAPGPEVEVAEAAGVRWALAATPAEARAAAGRVPGRRSGLEPRPPLTFPDVDGATVRLRTSWVEPAYLEPDASSCEPGGTPTSPLANGGAFGGKTDSPAPAAARALADRYGRAVRVLLSREDVVRLGPKRPPVAAVARMAGGSVEVVGRHVATREGTGPPAPPWVWRPALRAIWEPVPVPGPAASWALRGAGWAEQVLLALAALREAGLDPAAELTDERVAGVWLGAGAAAPGGAVAGAAVGLDPATGAPGPVRVRIAAGDPLDEVTLRSYAIGAVHMALGWVLSEGLSVDEDGTCRDLTIRSWRILPARATPPVQVEILDDPGPPRPRASDAVFAAVAAATWDALATCEGRRPEVFPARDTRTARMLAR